MQKTTRIALLVGALVIILGGVSVWLLQSGAGTYLTPSEVGLTSYGVRVDNLSTGETFVEDRDGNRTLVKADGSSVSVPASGATNEQRLALHPGDAVSVVSLVANTTDAPITAQAQTSVAGLTQQLALLQSPFGDTASSAGGFNPSNSTLVGERLTITPSSQESPQVVAALSLFTQVMDSAFWANMTDANFTEYRQQGGLSVDASISSVAVPLLFAEGATPQQQFDGDGVDPRIDFSVIRGGQEFTTSGEGAFMVESDDQLSAIVSLKERAGSNVEALLAMSFRALAPYFTIKEITNNGFGVPVAIAFPATKTDITTDTAQPVTFAAGETKTIRVVFERTGVAWPTQEKTVRFLYGNAPSRILTLSPEATAPVVGQITESLSIKVMPSDTTTPSGLLLANGQRVLEANAKDATRVVLYPGDRIELRHTSVNGGTRSARISDRFALPDGLSAYVALSAPTQTGMTEFSGFLDQEPLQYRWQGDLAAGATGELVFVGTANALDALRNSADKGRLNLAYVLNESTGEKEYQLPLFFQRVLPESDRLTTSLSVVDDNGGEVLPGDRLTYSLSIDNPSEFPQLLSSIALRLPEHVHGFEVIVPDGVVLPENIETMLRQGGSNIMIGGSQHLAVSFFVLVDNNVAEDTELLATITMVFVDGSQRTTRSTVTVGAEAPEEQPALETTTNTTNTTNTSTTNNTSNVTNNTSSTSTTVAPGPQTPITVTPTAPTVTPSPTTIIVRGDGSTTTVPATSSQEETVDATTSTTTTTLSPTIIVEQTKLPWLTILALILAALALGGLVVYAIFDSARSRSDNEPPQQQQR